MSSSKKISPNAVLNIVKICNYTNIKSKEPFNHIPLLISSLTQSPPFTTCQISPLYSINSLKNDNTISYNTQTNKKVSLLLNDKKDISTNLYESYISNTTDSKQYNKYKFNIKGKNNTCNFNITNSQIRDKSQDKFYDTSIRASTISNSKGKELMLLTEKEKLKSLFIRKIAHHPMDNTQDYYHRNNKMNMRKKVNDNVNISNVSNDLIERNLTRNFTPDYAKVREERMQKAKRIKYKKENDIPQVEFKVDFEAIKKRNKEIRFKKSFMK